MPTRKAGLPATREEPSEIRSKSIKADFARKEVSEGVEWSGQGDSGSGATRDLSGVTDANPTLGNWLRAIRSLNYIKLNLSACRIGPIT